VVLLVLSALLQPHAVPYSLAFFARHPSVLWELLLFCVVSCLGQVFVFFTVNHLGMQLPN
jgi:hypothetical protein